MPGRVKVRRGPKKSLGKSASTRERVTALCAALPLTEHEVRGDHAVYRVRGKVFAYFLDDHHGDGIVSVCVKSDLGENEDRARLAPERFYLPAHIGPRGWFGMRLDRGRVAWDEVAALLARSYRLAAPKSAVARLDGVPGASDNRRRPRKAARSRG